MRGGNTIAPTRRNKNNPNNFANVREIAKHHITWHRIATYTAIYKAGKSGKGKQTLTVHTIDPPPLYREFQIRSTLKVFKRTHLTKTKRRIIIMAATKGKKRTKKATDEDVEEIEGLEELEDAIDADDEDETVDTDEDVDTDDEADDDDEDGEEVETKKSKKKAKKEKNKQSRAAKEGKVGSSEIAAKANVDARTLRIVLRKHAIPKDPDSNRYEWDSFEDKTVKKIMKLLADGAADEAKKESFDKLKEKGDKKKKDKKDKKSKKNKKAKETTDEDDE